MDDAWINAIVGAEVRAARARRGWSRDELSARSGVSTPALRRYEAGTRSMPVDTLVRLINALGVDMSDINRAIRRAEDGAVSKAERAGSARDVEAPTPTEPRRRKAAEITDRIPRTADARKRRQD